MRLFLFDSGFFGFPEVGPARTVNQTVKILKRPFKIAREEGLIDRNPVAAVRADSH
jgi:hypothetical protein